MLNKDSLRQMGRKPTFNRSYSESSAHFLRRTFQEKKRENVNVSMTSSEKEPLMMFEEETNQERKRGVRGPGECTININCNPRHCWKESKKRKIEVSCYCLTSCLACSLMVFSVLAIFLYICYSDDNDKQDTRYKILIH